jgi:hypothetical protein
MMYAGRWANFTLCCVAALLILTARPATATATPPDVGSIKGTVSATTSDVNAHPALLAGARLTLVNRDLPGKSIKAVTDGAGNFIFSDLPAGTYLLSAEADGFPAVTREINLPAGAALDIEVVLTATVSETITVREEEGLLSQGETTTANTVRSQTLKDMPLRAENYQSAILLTPGVVRDKGGADHLKGARADQSAYTVNGADVTDPATGNLAFDIPLEAAASVQVEENPYSAEFGRLTGGATNLETKGGGDKFRLNATRFFPTFRNVVGGKMDSFRPRLTFSGPLVRGRLFFLQSFEYRFTRTRVPSLPSPRDNSTSENFNSFTQIDLNINKSHRAKFIAAFFPQKSRFVGLNTFNPQEVTPNFKQRGELFSVSEQAIFGDASFLTSALSYRTFDVKVFAQGTQPLTVTPDGNAGNYFADSSRQSRRLQWQETYYAKPLTLGGQHSFRLGGEFDRTRVTGLFHDRPVLIRRGDGTLAQRIDFAGDGMVSRSTNEFVAFVQDRWVVSKRLTFDAGLRFDRNGIARRNDFAPRLSFLYLPLKDDRTVVRGGAGLFYDRIPLSVGNFELDNEEDALLFDSSADLLPPSKRFTELPRRVVTSFAPDGTTVVDGPRRFRNRVENMRRVPSSLRWSLQLDRRLAKSVTARVGYLERSTKNELIIEPRIGRLNTGRLVLSPSGRSRYRELQLLATYFSRHVGNWSASYVWSKAEGDLNTADNFLGDFPALVVRPNEYGPLPFDAPHRFLAYGQVKTRFGLIISPSLEVRSGFPFSLVNERLDFVGARDRAGRFPTFLSLDVQATKDFTIPKFVPKLEGKKARVGAAVFNVTNHFNPRDVLNNTGSPRVGQFSNSLGTSVRGKFEIDF